MNPASGNFDKQAAVLNRGKGNDLLQSPSLIALEGCLNVFGLPIFWYQRCFKVVFELLTKETLDYSACLTIF